MSDKIPAIFFNEYEQYKNTPSDISEHLELLYTLGKEVGKICELGVGFGRSTRAFIAAIAETGGVLHSYEFKLLEGVQELFDTAKQAGLNANLHLESTLVADIEETDLMLVDSHHTYDQVWAELERHGDQVRKYLIFHDTVTFGISGQDPGSIGLFPAINKWRDGHPEWKIKYELENCNGLLVLVKE